MGAAIGMMLSRAGGGGGGGTDPSYSSVTLLLHGDGTNGGTVFTDNGPLGHVPTQINGVATSTAQFKFGTASLDFSTSAIRELIIDNPQTGYNFGSGQFTVECFARWTSAPGANLWGLVTQFGGSSNLGWFLGMVSGSLAFYYSTTGTDNPNVGAAFTPTLNQWYHIAADRDASNVLRVYKDGVVHASATVSSTFFASTINCIVGNDNNGTRQHVGYIDEVRVTKGVARYGGAFTAPTAAFPNS